MPLRSCFAAVVPLLAMTAMTACSAEHPVPGPSTTVSTLAEAAVRIGVAIDIYANGPGDAFPPAQLTPSVLDDADVTVPAGLSVTRYQRATRPDGGRFRDLANPDDYWQFCLSDPDGNWLTYGETTGMQSAGTEGDVGPACEFSGSRAASAPTDVRVFAAQAWTAITQDPRAEEPGYHYPQALDADTLTELGLALPAGWGVSDYDQRGYTALQYCVTAPGGQWFYVHDRAVARLGDTGSCALDPDMPSH